MSQKVDNNLKNAIVDIAKGLESVFKKYTKNTRTKAWDKITSKDGEKQVKKILNDPKFPINTFQKLATQKENIKFSDWLKLTEAKSSRTKSGKKVPGKYLAGLKEKGKHGSKEAMKKEIEKFRGKDEYKLDWDADYKHGKRIKTKKGKATIEFEKKFGMKKENTEYPIVPGSGKLSALKYDMTGNLDRDQFYFLKHPFSELKFKPFAIGECSTKNKNGEKITLKAKKMLDAGIYFKKYYGYRVAGEDFLQLAGSILVEIENELYSFIGNQIHINLGPTGMSDIKQIEGENDIIMKIGAVKTKLPNLVINYK